MPLNKCTQGDWTYVGDAVVGVVGDCNCPVMSKDPDQAEWRVYPNVQHESHDIVPPVFEDQLPNGVTMEEHMANCHLIAAVKKLFIALHDICERFEGDEGMDRAMKAGFDAELFAARVAIAEADPKEPEGAGG